VLPGPIAEAVRNLDAEADTEFMRSPAFLRVREWGLRTFKQGTMLRLSVACVCVELLIAASTLAPDAPVLPQWPQFLLFPLIFVVHFSSVLRVTPERGLLRFRQLLDSITGLPPALVIGFLVLFLGAWLVLMVSIGSIGGQPTISGGHYYLNDHGTLIPVTRAAYRHALVLQQRIFTLGPSVFFALGVLVHYPRRQTGTQPAAQPSH
jgi:hypothetical protein